MAPAPEAGRRPARPTRGGDRPARHPIGPDPLGRSAGPGPVAGTTGDAASASWSARLARTPLPPHRSPRRGAGPPGRPRRPGEAGRHGTTRPNRGHFAHLFGGTNGGDPGPDLGDSDGSKPRGPPARAAAGPARRRHFGLAHEARGRHPRGRAERGPRAGGDLPIPRGSRSAKSTRRRRTGTHATAGLPPACPGSPSPPRCAPRADPPGGIGAFPRISARERPGFPGIPKAGRRHGRPGTRPDLRPGDPGDDRPRFSIG